MPDPSAATPGGGYAPPAAVPVVQSAGMEQNLASALCYLFGWITGVVFLVLDPYNKDKTIRFHAFQSIFFNIALIPVYIVLGIFSFVLSMIPGIRYLTLLLWPLIGLAFLGMWLFLMYKAYNKEKFLLPLIGPLAEKQANS